MRILILAWRDPKHPLSGGAEQVMHEHAKGWRRVGHEVTIFSSKFDGANDEEILDGIHIIRRGFQYLGVQLAGFFYYQKNSKNYDLVVDQFHGLPFFTPLYVAAPKLAVIQEIAQEVWFLNQLPLPFNFLIGALGYLVEPLIFLLYKSVQFMTGSASTRDDLIKLGIPKEHIRIVPHGVIIQKLSPLPPKERIPTIAYLGILSRDKGIEDALRSFALLKKSAKGGPAPASPAGRSGWQFWVIGKAATLQYGERLERMAQELGLANAITFWGYVTQKKKFELLSRAHILVNPSVREGWGLVNIEANAVGTPVVAYPSPGLVDSVKQNVSGILTRHKTPHDLAQAILALVKNKKAYTKLSEGAVSWSQQFSWDKSFPLFSQIPQETVYPQHGILVLSWRGPAHPFAGGAEAVVHEHAKAWVDGGYRVTLFTSSATGLLSEEMVDGMRIIRRGRQIFGVQIMAFLYYLKHRKCSCFHLIIDNFHGIPFFTPLYVSQPKIAFIHEVAKEVWFLYPVGFLLNYTLGALGFIFEPFIFKIFYRSIPFLTVSRSTKKDLITFGIPSKNINVIINGVDVTKKPDKLPQKETIPTLIFFSTLTKDKGVEDAIQCFSYIARVVNPIKFWVMGWGYPHYVAYLKTLARDLGIESKTMFLGKVSEREKFRYLAQSHLLVFPSRREGWGLVVIEAAAVGTPTIAYNVPGLRDSVVDGKTGILSKSINPENLAHLAIELLNDKKKYESMRSHALSWSKTFSWERATKESLKLLERFV